MADGLDATLKKLRLSGLGESLEVRLHEASSRGLTHREFLELVLQDEVMIRNSRLISRRLAVANFRDQKSSKISISVSILRSRKTEFTIWQHANSFVTNVMSFG